MSYKCVDCKHVFTSEGHPTKCPKCGSEKWGKVDAKGEWTVQGESVVEAVDIVVKLRSKDYTAANEMFASLMQSKVNRVLAEERRSILKEEVTKRAVIRDTDTPVGKPGKMHLNCGCGTKVDMPGYPETGATCSKCGQKYDGRGYLVTQTGD